MNLSEYWEAIPDEVFEKFQRRLSLPHSAGYLPPHRLVAWGLRLEIMPT